VLNGIFYVLSTGCQWKALPKDLPPKSAAHYHFMLSQREQIPAWVASPCFPGHARLRNDGGDPPSRRFAAAQKNQTPNHGENKSIATPSLIRWSIQEVRRIAIRLARKQIQPAHIIAWSLWRRAHQAAAQRAHLKAKKQL
jgi:transposase